MTQDLPTKWPRSWDSLASARKKSNRLLLLNVHERFRYFEEENIVSLTKIAADTLEGR